MILYLYSGTFDLDQKKKIISPPMLFNISLCSASPNCPQNRTEVPFKCLAWEGCAAAAIATEQQQDSAKHLDVLRLSFPILKMKGLFYIKGLPPVLCFVDCCLCVTAACWGVLGSLPASVISE